MNPSDSSPKLPAWLFIVADLALLGAAFFIASQSARPLSDRAMFAIVACVILGTITALVPVLARHEREKNEALDDRQRALEALARTVSTSAEQISIAANGLHEIAEIAQKNLRQAEQLPHKLQEKIAEFQAQLAAAEDSEKEEMERELLALRTTESERLESVSQRIAKSSAEWAKLEAATQQHLAAANEALAKLSLGTAAAIGKAQVAAEQALAQARLEAARTIGEASGQAARAIDAARSAALADLDAQLAASANSAIERISRALDGKLAPQSSAPLPKPAEVSVETAALASAPVSAPAPVDIAPPSAESSEPKPDATAKRPRKPRPAAESAPVVATASEAPPAASAPPAEEPPPVPAEKIPEVAPVAPHTAEPFEGHLSNGSVAVATATPPAETSAAESAKPPRKRAAPVKKPAAESELGLELDVGSAPVTEPVNERVISSDGATRLLVTAYIGIGNRLFIRGAGPGLSWEKGVPLQFVSIGKWRWETNDANAPVQFKLYKNDDVECAALGAQTLDPGHQQEVTAAF